MQDHLHLRLLVRGGLRLRVGQSAEIGWRGSVGFQLATTRPPRPAERQNGKGQL
jgi:hypothetical protein